MSSNLFSRREDRLCCMVVSHSAPNSHSLQPHNSTERAAFSLEMKSHFQHPHFNRNCTDRTQHLEAAIKNLLCVGATSGHKCFLVKWNRVHFFEFFGFPQLKLEANRYWRGEDRVIKMRTEKVRALGKMRIKLLDWSMPNIYGQKLDGFSTLAERNRLQCSIQREL